MDKSKRRKKHYFRAFITVNMGKTFSLSFLFVLLGMNLFAHEFHVGMCYADYEEESQTLFCSIQLETRDFAHWLEDLSLEFNLDELVKNQHESQQWEAFESFILKHFSAKTDDITAQMVLFDIEMENDGRLFLNLLAADVQAFTEITWKFSLLMGHSMDQQNKLEFKYVQATAEKVYFAYFFENEIQKTIAIIK